MAIGDSFIGNNGEINIFMFFNAAVFLNFKSGAFCAKGDEERAGSEVIEMVINRRDSKGTKVCYKHAAVERRSLVDDFRHDSVIIRNFKEGDEKTDKKTLLTDLRKVNHIYPSPLNKIFCLSD